MVVLSEGVGKGDERLAGLHGMKGRARAAMNDQKRSLVILGIDRRLELEEFAVPRLVAGRSGLNQERLAKEILGRKTVDLLDQLIERQRRADGGKDQRTLPS